MGIFSSLTGSPKVSTPATGYNALPSFLQPQYKDAASQISNVTPTSAFMAPTNNAYQTQAFGLAQNAANPTASGISALLAAYQNPYDDSVVNNINREAAGANSLVTQQGLQAGQMGSNRNFLATSDVEQNRENNIQQFQQQEFNQNLATGLNQQQQGISNLLNIGNQQQQQAYQNQQAPFAALAARFGLIDPQLGYASGSRAAGSTGGGFDLGTTLKSAAGIASLFGSDRRLKQDIEYHAQENGYPTYKFKYKSDPSRTYIGVMAQNIMETDPDAVVTHDDGMMSVNYDKIGVKFRQVDHD